MTRPTARVLALLEILQAGGAHTATTLAARLEVDERTVRRYVEHLLDLDVPVRTERGRYGGYRLSPGFRMPPLMLTDDEALAVLLGLVAGQRSRSVRTSAGAAEAAIAKVRRVLPARLGQRLDALLATTDFRDAPQPDASTETDLLLTIAEAARDRQPLVIDYADRGGRRTTRTLQPYGIVARSGRWYVTGADSNSDDIRSFRLDRIQHVRVIGGSFAIPDGFDPAATLSTEIPYRHEVTVRVNGTVEQVRARLSPSIATVQPIPTEPPSGNRHPPVGDWVRVAIRAERLDWIPALLAGLDRPFVIEQPDSLRQHVHDFARRLDTYASA